MKWPTVPISEACDINPRGGGLVALPGDTQVTFVPMSAVSEASASVVSPEIRTFEQVRKGYTPFREGDVLFAKITPCMENGKAALAKGLMNGLGFGSTEFHVLRAKGETILPEFLYFFVRQSSFRDAAKQQMRGGVGQQRVPEDFVQAYPIPLPPLPEQRRIVEILDQADALRKKRAEADAKAARILPALFYHMFGDPATNPMGWPEFPVAHIAEVKGGKRLPKGSGYSPVPTEFRYIRGIDIEPNEIRGDQLLYLYPEVQSHIRRYTVNQGDVVVTIAGKIGVAAPVGMELAGANLTENAAKLVARGEDLFDPMYLSVFLNIPYCQSQIEMLAGRVTIGKLALFRVESIPILLPPIEQQQEFASRILMLQITANGQHSVGQRLNQLFDILLHRAFSGDLTAQWREAHMEELLAEMEHQARVLGATAAREQFQLPLGVRSGRET